MTKTVDTAKPSEDQEASPFDKGPLIDKVYYQLQHLMTYADLSARLIEISDYPAAEMTLDRVIGFARDIQETRRKIRGGPKK
jgi:hypothetical protein